MSVVPRSSLADAWPNMDDAARNAATADLSSYLNELSAVSPPSPAYIGSCSGGAAYDHRFNHGYVCGHFTSVQDHDFPAVPVVRYPRPEPVKLYRDQLKDSYAIVFAHADLGGDHIFVEPTTGRITGIIDWVMAS